MAMRSFSTLIPKINQSTIGCPQPILLRYIRDSAIRICERTLIWRYTEPKYLLQPGVSEYQYNKPDGTDVHVLFSAIMNDQPLELLTLEQAMAFYPKWADLYSGVDPNSMWNTTTSAVPNVGHFDSGAFNAGPTFMVTTEALADGKQPLSVCQLTPEKYIILPLPDNVRPYHMRMFYALKPSRDADSMDKAIFDDIEDLIVHTTLQQLLVMPGVAWTDRELAAYHAKQALYLSTERRARSNLANLRGQFTVRSNRFA